MSEPVLSAQGLCWVADRGLPRERVVLRGVDLSLRAGECIGIVGRSGAGKTTLATILAGLLAPSSGRVRGERVGLVFQEPERGFFEETVLADVAFGPRNLGLAPAVARERAEVALRRVGLDPARVGSRLPETLSGGEARRAAIAGILASEPAVVVFDEPTSGLDAEGIARLEEIVTSLRERGQACVIVSHELPLLIETCDRICLLEGGRVAWEGAGSDLAEAVPDDWRDPDVLGEDLLEVTRLFRERGWIGADSDPTPEVLARAWRDRRTTGSG